MPGSSAHPMTLLISRLLVGAFLGTSVPVLGWTVSGTVRDISGTGLAGVIVSVQDTASIHTSTGANGAFALGSTTTIGVKLQGVSGWDLRVSGRELLIQAPLDGLLGITLVDVAGRLGWSGSAVASGGAARISLPSLLGSGAGYLRVRHAGGELVQAVVEGPHGLQVAPHLLLSRALASHPVLHFSRSGFRDTSFSMASDSATDLSIVMLDTGSIAPCPTVKLSAGDANKSLSVGGTSRTYVLHVPSKYDGSKHAPLVLDFHGLGSTGAQQESSSPWKSVTDADGVVSVYPDGLQGPTGTGWNFGPCCVSGADDVAFAKAMVADVEKVACIDPARVYAVGYSMGGGMTQYLGCEGADVFAAVSPAAADLLKETEDACVPDRPITVVAFRGTADPAISYGGGSLTVSGMTMTWVGAINSFQKWALIDKCSGAPSAADANGCSTYSNCSGGVQVTLCTKQGGGHDQGNAAVGWPILKKYTLP